MSAYIKNKHKVVISVCLFVFSLVLRIKIEYVDFNNENLFPGKIVQVRVNGGSNYE